MEKPTLPKGTRDLGPAQMAKRQFIFDIIKKVFQKYGFQPLETPAMENLSTLTGKYGEEGDQLLFKVLNSGDAFKDIKKDSIGENNIPLIKYVLIDRSRKFILQERDASPNPMDLYIKLYERIKDPLLRNFLHPKLEEISKILTLESELFDQKINEVIDDSADVFISTEIQNSEIALKRITEKGLRYDLTVPFARYVVMNKGEITFPFKRYQIQPVWRADRPQKGRYREFYQCDADVVGTESLICEAEIILMIKEVFKQLGILDYSIKINHRGILSGLAELANAKENESSLFVAIDKLDKIGEEKVKEELASRGFDQTSLTTVFEILNFSGSTQQKIDFLTDKFSLSAIGQKGISDFKEVLILLKNYGATEENVEFDVSLARGLSYYTGCIFEVKINNVGIGSVSGGGRYDNLTAMFDDKEKLSGVGFSFGVDRLYDAMTELETKEKRSLFPEGALISSQVLVCHTNNESMIKGLRVLAKLREAGIASEIHPEAAKAKKPLEKPLQYALKKSIPYAIVIDSTEELSTLKTLKTGEQEQLSLERILERLKS